MKWYRYIIALFVVLIFLIPLALSASVSRPSFEIADNPVPSYNEINFSINFTLDIITPGDQVVINASIFDISGIDSARAEISEYDGPLVLIVPLYDDGTHNDGDADDGIYGNIWDTTGLPDGLYEIDIWTNDTLGYINIANASSLPAYPFLSS